jgi:23S rRNA (uridine2552-2'-O)-methyltransferase
MSDVAAPTTGHRPTDHLRTMGLLEAALDMAEEVLKPGGTFVGKVFHKLQDTGVGVQFSSILRNYQSRLFAKAFPDPDFR